MKTAMQELKSDLLTAIDTCNEALEEINDLQTREACQAVVKITIDNILNRIDNELLAMEKEQIMDAYEHGQNNGYMYRDGNSNIIQAEQYYNETFKSK
jgi:molecular chaperone GrpE (heat shock protein)